MKYIQPAGEAADASYVDGNRSAGTKGSVVPAAAIEHPQREIQEVITFFGLTPSSSDLAQLRKAIEAAILAATGGGDTSQYVLITQARARLPIFPEIQSADGKMNVTSPSAGTVQVPSAVSFQHRGIYPVSTSDYIEDDRTFTTLANKTYHLRWTPTDGFSLEDLADSGYNPSVLAESNVAFDSAYDDMLVARVVTDASNVATITNLVNRDRLFFTEVTSGTPASGPSGSFSLSVSKTIDWARTPKMRAISGNVASNSPSPAGSMDGYAAYLSSFSVTRYAAAGTVVTDWASGNANTALVGYMSFDLAG
ncbi:hypothetical protein [Hoeflea alexandrii]|uniref:Uncharacterized protein n=1 Tax=Hoeflea alexandrii TaxID=288436 RepID=A0ABT1CVZ8_9HYPH|nr:hypothetical protein [Hoeflea alexandrii]MCO6410108.1 hypothetical protein [Hoeflea alexandrii]